MRYTFYLFGFSILFLSTSFFSIHLSYAFEEFPIYNRLNKDFLEIIVEEVNGSPPAEIIAAVKNDRNIYVFSQSFDRWEIIYSIGIRQPLGQILVCDFDGDGLKNDIVYTIKENSNYNALIVDHFQKGKIASYFGNSIDCITSGDIDGDKDDEIIFVEHYRRGFNTEKIFALNLINSQIETTGITDISMGWKELLMWDFDRDGRKELFALSSAYGLVTIYDYCPDFKNWRIYTNIYHTTMNYADSTINMKVANNNLILDNFTTPLGTIFEYFRYKDNPYNYYFHQRMVESNIYIPSPLSVEIADVNNDGQEEIVAATLNDGMIFLYYFEHPDWHRITLSELKVPISMVMVGNIDQDKVKEIVVPLKNSGKILIFKMLSPKSVLSNFSGVDLPRIWQKLLLADIDDDARMELIVADNQGISAFDLSSSFFPNGR